HPRSRRCADVRLLAACAGWWRVRCSAPEPSHFSAGTASAVGELVSTHSDRPQVLTMTNRQDEKEKRYLPVHDPAWVANFAQEYFDELAQEARRSCWKHNVRDYADDALSIAFEKFMSSRIEDRGPRSAI